MKSYFNKVVNAVSSVRQHTWLKVFVLACVVWCFWYPKRMESLYMAIPAGATLGTYHNGLASEWKGLVNNETLVSVLKGFGLEEADELKNESGIYQTMFWLTGRHTVVGFVPQSYRNTIPEGILAAASYVGWKAKFMEFLWRIKWIPGLGKLQTTPNGTRYLVFEASEEFGGFLVLGLDIVDGVLIATLSKNAEDVCVMADRLYRFGPKDSAAIAFNGEKPWKTKFRAKHVVWISDTHLLNGIAPAKVEVSSLRDPTLNIVAMGKVESDWLREVKCFGALTAAAVPCADVPDAAAAVLVAGDAAILAQDDDPAAPPAGNGMFVGYLSGKPYQARLMGLAYPAANLAMLGTGADAFGEWAYVFSDGLKRDFKDAGIKTNYKADKNGGTLWVFSSLLELMGKASQKDMAFAELRENILRFGSHYGSYEKQRTTQRDAGDPSIADTVIAWQSAYPAAVAALRIDLPVAAEEFAHLGAIAKLGLSFSGGPDSVQMMEQITVVSYALTALRPLGLVECIAIGDGSGVTELRIATKQPDRTN